MKTLIETANGLPLRFLLGRAREPASERPEVVILPTICNFFVNHRSSLADILRVLDEDDKHVHSNRDLSMNGVGVPEKGLSRSQSIRCLETSAVLMKIWQKGFPLEQRMLSEGRCG